MTREYIATKTFFAGEINQRINDQERIQFDGFKAVIRGQEYKCSSLMAAIKAGLLALAQVDKSGKTIEQAEPITEAPEARAKRLKEERLRQINGAKGNGEILEEVSTKPSKVVKRDGTPVKKKEPEAVPAPEVKRQAPKIIQESEGEEVAKIKKSASGTEEDSSKSFFEALLDGERKKLEVARDQYATKKVVKTDDQSEAVEVKKLVDSVESVSAEIAPAKDPLKGWKSMNSKKKEAFIKKATDTSLIKRIIDSEGGAIRRKAEERLAEVDHAKESVGQHP